MFVCSRVIKSLLDGGRQTKAALRLSMRTMSSGISSQYKYETLEVSQPSDNVLQVMLNRPEKRNAMNRIFWKEMVECFTQIDGDQDCRAVVLCAAGQTFTSGLDLTDAQEVFQAAEDKDIARRAFFLRELIRGYQESFTVIEKCKKPVLAAIHSACIGGGVDMVTACDIRYCTQDAWFEIKEVDIGLAADVGTLQRIPKIIGNDSLVRELVYTGRRLYADEAKECGLVNRVFQDKEVMLQSALDLAVLIASKSPVAVQSSKVALIYSRDHSVPESLDQMATWNMSMLQTEDIMKAVVALMSKAKDPPNFSKL
ncbi:PREDICTED: delta(3,5)-Delta(2,4)-dienoyl-CoA isomerase, mitochondrial-like [Priapulus caudatus]|uniref:Delta(3,5)-Delta(2,4)-dienoyl-CoA isomerase, mitochondrial-like n=1 Tax=Priapulus caudatus TaxID=37621 RepID=A0ABM1DN55_PRICU|nr:PREDICTED: delta(3,5)-Delta(2,4)-dienoyl-CoA isomerase, mitochondrial-like [Priapulus caudatus]